MLLTIKYCNLQFHIYLTNELTCWTELGDVGELNTRLSRVRWAPGGECVGGECIAIDGPPVLAAAVFTCMGDEISGLIAEDGIIGTPITHKSTGCRLLTLITDKKPFKL